MRTIVIKGGGEEMTLAINDIHDEMEEWVLWSYKLSDD
jgi:hypothetical protein